MSGRPSLASVTGSRVDSATKHVRTCRVADDLIKNWMKVDLTTLRANKLLHAVQKDDIFIGCGRCMFNEGNNSDIYQKAYAVGIGNLDAIDAEKRLKLVMTILTMIPFDSYEYVALRDYIFKEYKEHVDSTRFDGVPEFYFEGVALTTGHPHGHLGDTALSVITGGMITIRNGPFDMHAGDLVTWVWEFELCMLQQQGCFVHIRDKQYHDVITYVAGAVVDTDTLDDLWDNLQDDGNDADRAAKRRKMFMYSQMNDFAGGPNTNKRKNKPVLIPLPINYSYILRKRMIGRCLSHGRPYDMTDILISRQGM